MTADVEVISAETRDALLVPVEALEETPGDRTVVSIVREDGELEEREVEAGLTDAVNAEVLSRLELGEMVKVEG
jgi:multidrug efflux pump subunit AcrA (membrane-fusion protein)